MFLKISQYSQEKTCVGGPQTATQVFFCEYCEIFKNSIFYRTPLGAASDCLKDAL